MDSTLSFTTTAGSIDYSSTDYKPLVPKTNGLQSSNPQQCRFSAEATTTTGAAPTAPTGTNTIRVVCFSPRDSKIKAAWDGTITWTSIRTGTDGASGGYIGTVAWAESGTSLLDLLGNGGSSEGPATTDTFKVGITTAAAFPTGCTQINLHIALGGWPNT